MKYIDLSLKKHDKQESDTYILDKVIQNHEIIVLLGAPGSGKTSILKKYKGEHNKDTKFLNVKKFLKFDEKNNQITSEIKFLLLDGLDEYRSTENDKAFVLTDLGNKINKLENIKIVISCREMDWYGETDQKALKDEINKDAVLYRILPLNEKEKNNLSKLLKIKNSQDFIDKFSGYGFLENPHMFTMLADIYKENPQYIVKSKRELYLSFVKSAKEANLTHLINKTNEIETEEFLKHAGYIAFFYMFCGVDEFDKEFIDEISSSADGYSRKNIEKTTNTKIFQAKTFIHRTIAEFVLSYFIAKYKLEGNNQISIERVKALFMKKNRVPTELRGTFAWLCSETKNEELIKVDPYYQAVHGDNSLFNTDFKKEIIIDVKKYFKKNPYSFEFRQTNAMAGFYNDQLEDFLIEEFDKAQKLKNHYIYFILSIFESTYSLSENVKQFLQSKVLDKTFPVYYKYNIITILQDDICFFKNVLEQIKNGSIDDDKNDRLKEILLGVLYPNHLDNEGIVKYLMLYKGSGHFYYLYHTEYEKKFKLVDEIYKASYDKNRTKHLIFPGYLKYFIDDYFLETLLKYDKDLTAKDIYKTIKHFKRYYNQYEGPGFNSHRYKITDKLKANDKKLTELANELFSLYIDDILEEDNGKIVNCVFYEFFNFKIPNNQSNILIEKITATDNIKTKRKLFILSLQYLPRDKDNKAIANENITSLAKTLGLKKELGEWVNPKKQDWQIRNEKEQEELDKEFNKVKKANEKHFSNKTDKQIQSNFGDLHFIAEKLYFNIGWKKEIHLTNKTFKRLKKILKNTLFFDPFDPEFLTIQSLAKESHSANRNIDIVYYVSSTLNSESDILNVNKEFLKYLYINALAHKGISNVVDADFIDWIETNSSDFVNSTLKEYIQLLLVTHYPKFKDIIMPYITTENQIDNLKRVAMYYRSNFGSIQDNLLNNFINAYNFKINLPDLITFSSAQTNDENKSLVLALKTLWEEKINNFTMDMAISLHSLFGYDHLNRFKEINNDLKVRIIDYMMNVFDTEESIKSVNGAQSPKDSCASFLRENAINLLELKQLKELLKYHCEKDDIWTFRITHKINELEQLKSDQSYKHYSINYIKNFIISDKIISNKDFFADICFKIQKLKKIIEANRDNDKDPFYNQDSSSKNEGACRDVILHRLKDKYGLEIDLTKEKHEADNKADINIKYKENINYEVQIECKKGNNKDINTGIPNQLIDKYLSSIVQYGIYLIFYFGDKKNKSLLLKKVDDSIPKEYRNNIKVICIDLTY